MRELAERASRRITGVFLILLPVAIFVSIGVATSDDTADPEEDAVAFVLNQSPDNLDSKPESEISTRPPVTAQTPETSTPSPTDQPAPPPDQPTPTEPAPAADQAPPTEAPTTKAPATLQAPRSPTERGQAALAMIDYPWAERLPGWEISFHPERSGVYGYTLVRERRIEVYVRSGQSDGLLAHVVAHEIGHAIDVTHNDGNERDQWLQARGIAGTTWWPNDGASDFSTGAGDFAESFAAWQVGAESFRSKLGPSPTGAQLDVLRQLALN